MAWILQCILLVSLVSTHGSEIADARTTREGERAVNHKPNGSYKILNRFVKPFVNKRVDFDAFVFPEVSSKTDNEISSVIPDECKRLGICDDIPNYPEELVAHLIRKALQENGTKFNKDVLEIPQIAERIGPEEENIELCASSERLYAPRAAQDMNNEWYVILNDKQKPQQTFRVEICQQKNSPCSSIAYFQTGYQSMCIQKYMLRRMVALNEQKEVVERPFQVPSCCSCVARAV